MRRASAALMPGPAPVCTTAASRNDRPTGTWGRSPDRSDVVGKAAPLVPGRPPGQTPGIPLAGGGGGWVEYSRTGPSPSSVSYVGPK